MRILRSFVCGLKDKQAGVYGQEDMMVTSDTGIHRDSFLFA